MHFLSLCFLALVACFHAFTSEENPYVQPFIHVTGFKTSDTEVLMEFDNALLSKFTFADSRDTDKFINSLLTEDKGMTEVQGVSVCLMGKSAVYDDMAANLDGIQFNDERGTLWKIMIPRNASQMLRVICDASLDRCPEYPKSEDYLIAQATSIHDYSSRRSDETAVDMKHKSWRYIYIAGVPVTKTSPVYMTAFLYRMTMSLPEQYITADAPQLNEGSPIILDFDHSTMTIVKIPGESTGSTDIMARLAAHTSPSHDVAADVPSVYEQIEQRSAAIKVPEFPQTSYYEVDVAGVYRTNAIHVLLALDSVRLVLLFHNSCDARRFVTAVASIPNETRVQQFMVASVLEYIDISNTKPFDQDLKGFLWRDGFGSSWELVFSKREGQSVVSLRTSTIPERVFPRVQVLKTEDILLSQGRKPFTVTLSPVVDKMRSNWDELSDYPFSEMEIENPAPLAVFYQQQQVRIFENAYFDEHKDEILKRKVFDLAEKGYLFISPCAIGKSDESVHVTFTVRFVKARDTLYDLVPFVSETFIQSSE